MPTLIDSFLATVKQNGFVKSNRFVAFIRPNKYVAEKLGYFGGAAMDITSRLALTCFSASIQAPTLMTNEFNITSPQRLIPYASNSNNASGMSMEFYCLGDFFEKEVFHLWQRNIVDPTTRSVAYYDDYAKGTEIDIVILPNFVRDLEELVNYMGGGADDLPPLPGYTFTEVYPLTYTYNGGSVNYSASTAPATVKVDFMFREMHPFNWTFPPLVEMPSVDSFTPFTDKDTLSKVYTPPGAWQTLYNAEAAKAEYENAQREFTQYQKSLTKIEYEKQKIAQQYNQSSNIPRGVDGNLLNPKVDGLPAENPNDRIRQSLFGVLSFVQQAQGFGII
jgi:hypothetical protein